MASSPYNILTISGSSIASCLGFSFDDVARRMSNQEVGLKKSHRFSDWLAAPVGELDFSYLGSSAPSLYGDSAIFDKVLAFLLDELNKQTSVFTRYKPEEIGLFIGMTTGGVPGTFEAVQASTPHPKLNLEMQSHQRLEKACRDFAIKGFSTTISTACSSGALAAILGQQAIEAGIIKTAIVGGMDILNLVTICGFDGLQLIDADHCQPMSLHNQGLNLSEGGALLLLEAKQNVSEPICTLRGYGMCSEGYHFTQPEPNGLGMALSMNMALQNAGLTANEISYVSAHGTGTFANDKSEKAAIALLWPEENIRVDAPKKYLGHSLGGCGAIELALCVDMLMEPSRWSSYLQKFSHRESTPYLLSNSFGFGGSNVSLIVEGLT